MANLEYIGDGWWKGSVNIEYTVSYDAKNNRSSIVFGTATLKIPGKNLWNYTADTTITVQAADNTASSGTATLHNSGNTNGGVLTVTGNPSPTSITVQHGSADGDKYLNISASILRKPTWNVAGALCKSMRI